MGTMPRGKKSNLFGVTIGAGYIVVKAPQPSFCNRADISGADNRKFLWEVFL